MSRWFALDTGSAKNACALAGFERSAAGLYFPIVLREWRPSPGRPLDLRLVVLPEAMRIITALKGEAVGSDTYSISDVKICAAEAGLQVVVPPSDSWDLFRHIWTVTNRSKLALAPTGRTDRPDAETLQALRAQLGTVQRRPGAQGKWIVTLPEIEGLHGDLAVAAARSLWMAKAADADFETIGKDFDPDRYGGRSRYAPRVQSSHARPMTRRW